MKGAPATEPGCLRPFLTWLLQRHASLEGVTEIRVLRKGRNKGTWAGYFCPEDIDALIAAVLPPPDGPRSRLPRGGHPRSGEANFYFSLQAVQPALAEGRRGALTRARSTTRDADVLATTLFVVDVDPEREPRDQSATGEEKAASREVAEAVRAWLLERQVHCIWADSGNGYHLLVPLVPNPDRSVRDNATDARDLLRLLHKRFSTDQAKVDTSTFNPSRILKLYGTRAVKGEASDERPHRMAKVELTDLPADVDLFAAVASDLEAHRRPSKPKRAPKPQVQRSPPPRNRPQDPAWRIWRDRALESLPLESIYGAWLTGKDARAGWLECRDPASPSGDKNPSAGVADGGGTAERAAFHSFRSGETVSVFDFLIRSGRAQDFRQACQVIAELSGEPTPGQHATAATGASIVATFKSSWEAADSDETRRAAVHQTIEALLGLSAMEREPLLKQVRAAAGIRYDVFRETVAEIRKAIRQRERTSPPPPPPPSGDRPVVDYITNRDTVDGLFGAIVEAVRPMERLFSTGKALTFVDPGVGPIPVHDKNVGGLTASMVELRFLLETDEGTSFLRYGVLPSDLSRAFVNSPGVRRRLPRLKMYMRSPSFDRAWRFIGQPGFHPQYGIFYDGPKVEPTAKVDLLCEALKGFHWKGEADLVSFVGALLTAVTMPHWGRGHPFLAVNGNKPGVGKSTLARVLGVIVEGDEPNTVSFTSDDSEFEKQLATRVEAGDRVIVIDNAKTRRSVQSAVLERCITDTRLNFRRLGSNTAISRPVNDLLICLTMNLTHLGADLRRRPLPVNLELDESVRSTTYALPDVVGFVVAHRLELVAELAGMVLTWVEAGKPGCERPARHSTSQAWAGTMDAVLRLSGFDGFLTNLDESEHAFDPKYQLMMDLCAEHHAKSAATASRWAEWSAELLEDRFKDRRGNPKSARARSTIVGNLFTEYLDTHFVVEGQRYGLVRDYPDGATRSATYRFREVAE